MLLWSDQSASTGQSEGFSSEVLILVGSVKVNPRNLIGTSGRKKPSFY